MTTRTVERVGDWDAVPFDGGYAGLRSLAADEFSGVVVSGPTQLFMLKGTVVGVLDGDIEAFDGAAGTAREAPHEALPLLAVMQERAEEVRGKYYSEETPLAEVDRTLSDGKFTGFVELSENVLSGDYYVVYHQGRKMSAAFVGSSGRLVTDEDAFQQADDEVGIFAVKPVDIDPVEIPDDGAAAGSAGSDESGAVTGASADPDPSGSPTDGPGATDSDAGETSTGDGRRAATETPSDDAAATDDADGAAENGAGPAPEGPPGSKAAGASHGTAVGNDRERGKEDATAGSGGVGDDADSAAKTRSAPAETGPSDSTAADAAAEPPAPGPSDHSDAVPDAEPGPSETHAPGPAESAGSLQSQQRTADTGGEREAAPSAADLETRTIPSLDPERSGTASEQGASSGQRSQPATGTESGSGQRRDHPGARSSQSQTQRETSQQSQTTGAASSEPTAAAGADGERVETLEATLSEREAELEELQAELERAESTAEDLREERDRLESELSAAREEIERLERRLSEAQGGAASASTTLSPSEAIGNTNLFVRYHSKGEATLENASEGAVSREDVEQNLRLEYHTQFDAEDVTVDGQPYEEFLYETLQYRFVEWLVGELLYEIGTTGHKSSMQDLFDAIPRIDRAELDGQVSTYYVEDGKENRSQERFDVVVRDRLGNPLIVANINNSREPATDDQMTTLVRDGERVGNASDTLAAAFLVTSSFFEPEALETAEEATTSGLFSRGKRASYVNLSRKDGYHLCLLEARNREFHLAVPEL